MEQHCDWIVHGTAGLRGKGRTRMRPKLHLPALGHALRASGDKACSSFGRVRCDTSIYPRGAKQTRRFLGGSLSCLVTLMASDFGRVIRHWEVTARVKQALLLFFHFF